MRVTPGFLVAFIALLCAGCSSAPTLMRVPAIYEEGLDPYADNPAADRSTTIEVMYATDRNVVEDAESFERYGDDRGDDLRLGTARVGIGKPTLDWEEVHANSLTDDRDDKLELSVDSMQEFGWLRESMTFIDDRYNSPDAFDGQRAFAQAINDRLERSPVRDIYIYVAQFKVGLDDALYSAAEFHHFMGREGVFLAYSWPTKEGILDYFSSAESAYATVRNLRELIRFLGAETNVEKIHLLTYSAGARVVAYTIHSLRLMCYDLDAEEAAARFRIGQVIYTGPDLDARIFGRHYQDGMADLPDQITIYTTTRDKALAMSRRLYGRERLGAVDLSDMSEEAFEYTRLQTRTNFIRVSDVEKIKEANSHGYFRHSPWVSSDIIMLLKHGLRPAQRGLDRDVDEYRWDFPEDYPERVRDIARLLAAPSDPGNAPSAAAVE